MVAVDLTCMPDIWYTLNTGNQTMDSDDETKKRKNDHIRINLEENIASSANVGFDVYAFTHEALPELDLAKVKLDCVFLGESLKIPLLISSMTGGTKEGDAVNIHLAEAAQHLGIAMGVGSQRSEILSDEAGRQFNIRTYAQDVPLYANLGAVQLNYGFGIDECKKAVSNIQANALILHLNPLQEALQPEGQTNFSGILRKIELICSKISIPVIVKEVGWGISTKTACNLVNAGVSCIDVAGAGGTSWAMVEKYRNTDENRIAISEHFQDWGIPTAESLRDLHHNFPEIPLIASGGIKKGIDIAKSIALGAQIAGVAGILFKAAVVSTEAVIQKISEITDELRITMFVVGAGEIPSLANTPIHKK